MPACRIENCLWLITLVVITAAFAIPANAEEEQGATDEAAELAQTLANPISSLISVPLQRNYDEHGGSKDGLSVSRLNIQPGIPFSLTDQWNVITRAIVPLIDQSGFPVDAMNESGLGDIVASQFFSPRAPTARGWIWGARPVECAEMLLRLVYAADAALCDKLLVVSSEATLSERRIWKRGIARSLENEMSAESRQAGLTTGSISTEALGRNHPTPDVEDNLRTFMKGVGE